MAAATATMIGNLILEMAQADRPTVRRLLYYRRHGNG
jgi:hypothetical protein